MNPNQLAINLGQLQGRAPPPALHPMVSFANDAKMNLPFVGGGRVPPSQYQFQRPVAPPPSRQQRPASFSPMTPSEYGGNGDDLDSDFMLPDGMDDDADVIAMAQRKAADDAARARAKLVSEYQCARMSAPGITREVNTETATDAELQLAIQPYQLQRKKWLAIEVGRKVVVVAVFLMEAGNKRFVPQRFRPKLDGWGNNVQACEIASFDDALIRLFQKYMGEGGNMEPEFEILLLLAFSGFNYHMAAQLSSMIPGATLNQIASHLNQNPQFANTAINSVVGATGLPVPGTAAHETPSQLPPQGMAGGAGGLGGIMSSLLGNGGIGSLLGNLFGGGGGGAPPPTPPQNPNQPLDDDMIAAMAATYQDPPQFQPPPPPQQQRTNVASRHMQTPEPRAHAQPPTRRARDRRDAAPPPPPPQQRNRRTISFQQPSGARTPPASLTPMSPQIRDRLTRMVGGGGGSSPVTPMVHDGTSRHNSAMLDFLDTVDEVGVY